LTPRVPRVNICPSILGVLHDPGAACSRPDRR
jgi:hypothetical protein